MKTVTLRMYGVISSCSVPGAADSCHAEILILTRQQALTDGAQQQDAAYLESLPIDGNLAMDVLNNVVGIGPRLVQKVLQQQKMLKAILKSMADGRISTFKAKNPISQQVEVVDMANMLCVGSQKESNALSFATRYPTWTRS